MRGKTRAGIDADAAHRFCLPCGGLIELVLEPVLPRTQITELLARLSDGERVRRVLTIATGEVALQPATDTDELSLSDTQLTTHHGPHWRLLLIGAGQMTQYLAQMATALGYQVLVCDPREEYATGFEVPGAVLLRTMPDDTVVSAPASASASASASATLPPPRWPTSGGRYHALASPTRNWRRCTGRWA